MMMLVSIAACRRASLFLAAFVVGLAACSGDIPVREPARAPDDARARRCPSVTWASAYGDAATVPTRAGERIRHELATADAIERALLATRRFERVHVVLRLGSAELEGRAEVIVTPLADAASDEGVDVDVDANVDELDALVRDIVRASVHEPWRDAQTAVVTTASAPARGPEPLDSTRRVLLALCLLALGASAGVAFERLSDPLRYPRGA